MIAKCPCEHCGVNIEFATEEFLSGSSVPCPTCGKETTLSTMNVSRETESNQIVNCPCQQCGGEIGFDAGELVEENSLVPCPHCGAETKLVIPPTAGDSNSDAPAQQDTPQKKNIGLPATSTGIYLQIQEEKRGPYAKSQVQTMWNNGLITLDALYWQEGMADWGEISDLFTESAGASPATNTPKQQPVATGVNVANLMELAKAAATANNPKEAYDYYTKVLEHEPRNITAWVGKAVAAGWMSTLPDIKATEMIAAFNNALNYAPESDKQDLRKHAANEINRVTSACYGMARKHLAQFFKVINVWPAYVEQCRTLISALEVGYIYDPANKTTVENIVHISQNNIDGFTYSPDGLGLIKKKFSVTPQYEAILRAKIDQYTAFLLP